MVTLNRIGDYTWEIPLSYDRRMKVPGRIYASERLLSKMKADLTLQQCANVAQLPGIYKYSITLPDGHQGYGFPIGGVAAFDANEGIISPGGVGYDINCGVRLIRTNLTYDDIKDKLPRLVDTIFRLVPCGVGRHGKISLSYGELERVLVEGVKWAVDHGYGWEKDMEHIEERGCLEGADPDAVSTRAKSRGAPQLGTLGAGNHFLEIAVVDKIYDPETAKVMGIRQEGQVVVWIHTGSRGFGHQVASDYIRIMERAIRKYGIRIPDRELCCAPFTSREAEQYMAAMACAVNFAFVNRQMITHWTREAFERVLGTSAEDLDMHIVYGVCHNVAKVEYHYIDGIRRKVVVHRKGATRAFPPEHPDIPADYRAIGQPVLVVGSMGTASYVLVGTKEGEELTFSSATHGAGRTASRARAVRMYRASDVERSLASKGIYIRAASKRVVAEEAPQAYKDIDEVVRVTDAVGFARKIVRTVPKGVCKG